MKNFRTLLICNHLFSGGFLLFNFCIIAMVVVGIYACTDHDSLKSTDFTKDEAPIVPRSPSTTGDRVYFSDIEDFVDYYNELDDLMETYDGDYFDSIVNLTTSVQTLNDIVYTTAGYFPTIYDYHMRAIINPYNEFQIDDILITLITDSQWLLSDASNGTLKTTIRGVTKGVPLEIEEIPAEAQWVDPNDLVLGIDNFWCGCRAKIEAFDCNTIRVYGSCSGFFGSVGGGEIDIDVNNSSILDDDPVGNNFEYFVEISQFHGESGTLDVTVNPNCVLALNYHTEYEFDPEDFEQCDENEVIATDLFVNNTERIRAIVYYNKKDLAGIEVTRTHNSEMFSESFIGNVWTLTKAEMTVGVEANQRSLSCSLLDSKDDDKHRNNRAHIQVRVNWLALRMFHCDGDLIGTYEKDRDNLHIEDELSADFHCCNE